jgi:ADP-ribose pyrophosphatase YjhB (NUDIX family)
MPLFYAIHEQRKSEKPADTNEPGGCKESVMSDYRYCPCCGAPLGNRVIDGTTRQACGVAGCGFVHWDNPVPVVAGIVLYEGRVLLARNRQWPEKTFALISGFLEKDEAPAQAIVREIREELGLESAVDELVGLYSFGPMNQLLIVYEVRAWGHITLGQELAQIKLFEPATVRPWPFGTGPGLRDWLVMKGHLKH